MKAPLINLISDTITQPSIEMLKFMMAAKTGDDVFREDPSVNKLEEILSATFGMEAGLFCPSGTMANQIAIKAHTKPLDEMICEVNSHVYQFEVGGYAFHSGIAVTPIISKNGKLDVELIQSNIRPNFDWFPNTQLVVLENTGNRAGGNYYTLEEIKNISLFCKEQNLKLHMDGARIFNAIIESNYTTAELGAYFDSISICLSKGLGAPVGSVLIGSATFISIARKIRKVMGGGMRQSGLLAAAGIYALENNAKRLKEDHIRAKQIEACLQKCDYVASIKPVYTNIIIFELKSELPAQKFLQQLKDQNILAHAFGLHMVRFVTHLDFTEEMLDRLLPVLRNIEV
ncbi:MAG: aminotransferase class I/II-fold pyridoxal phosphate-dependent enzyme [Saprospiraceae bacterium]|nr:aminotransferase class I/II-fold pyridoxal phosphate-dependent enzyme [Saprospiraceae bacterium]